MPTLRWIAVSYASAFMALVVMLALTVLAAFADFALWLLPFLIVPAMPAYVAGRTYRFGMNLGTSSARPLLFCLAAIWLFLGVAPAYLGYGTTSWALWRRHPEAKVAGMWQYLMSPSEIRPLQFVYQDREVMTVNMLAACGLGAIMAFLAAVAGLRKPSAGPASSKHSPADGDPAAFFDRTVINTDSKTGQRVAGLILVVLAGGAMFLLWRAPGRGQGDLIPAIVIPLVLSLGLGLTTCPFGPAGIRKSRRFRITWTALPLAGLAGGFFYAWLLGAIAF